MIDHSAGFVMLNPDCRLRSRSVAGPFDMPRNDVFRALEPFKANHRSRAALRLSARYAALREGIDLFAVDGVLG